MQPSKPEELEMNPLFTTVSSRINEKIDQTFKDPNSLRCYKSFLTGGSITANAVVNLCEVIKNAWGGGDETKALKLIKLFILLMLLQTFIWSDKQKAEMDDPENVKLTAISNTLSLFDDNTEEEARGFLNLYEQFKYEVENKTHRTNLGVLLLAMACQACGHTCLDWSKVEFPIESPESLTGSGAVIDDAVINNTDDIRTLWVCRSKGVLAMFKYHQEKADS